MVLIQDFLSLSQKQLTEKLVAGHPIDPKALDNYEYKGISLGLPDFIDKLAWKTFKKVFHRDPQSGKLRGWNIRIQQTGLEGEYLPMQKNGDIFAWGHYEVVSIEGRPNPKGVSRGLLIDYGLGGNRWYELMVNPMRDPLVALIPGSSEALLGWSYYEFGPLRVSTPSFFLLLRDKPLGKVIAPPVTR